MKKVCVQLKNGTTVYGDEFDESDLKLLKEIFNDLININKKLKLLNGRNLNIPDVLSEALYCVFFDAVRTTNDKKTKVSYDAVDKKTGEGIQIKSCSIDKDCTSFGPKTKWDKLIFIDFAPNGEIDGSIWFYEINCDLDNIVLNKKKGQTFKSQREHGRRPRLSIKEEIIKPQKLNPVLKINLYDEK